MKYLAILSLLFFFINSCSSPELMLEEQYFSSKERELLDGFLEKMEHKFCLGASDENFSCFNTHLIKSFEGINAKRDANFNLNAVDFITNAEAELVDLLFIYSTGQEKRDPWTAPVERKFLRINNNGKFVNFADHYCKESNNGFLKKAWELSNQFKNPGPKLLGYLYKNAAAISYAKPSDRLLFSVLYVILDYNMSFIAEAN